MTNIIINDDCFNAFDKIEPKSINMILVDLPYGQTACNWDVTIDLKKMWENLKNICTDNCQYIFFCTTKFGNTLINSNPKWFKYDLVWEKSNSVGFLSCNKIPLRRHEMIYIFNSANTDDILNERNNDLRLYATKIKKYINIPTKQINKIIGNQSIDHFFRYKSSQFDLCTEITYNLLIHHFKINDMVDFIEYDKLNNKKPTYNPQKIPGKPYTIKGNNKLRTFIYGDNINRSIINNTGDRYPSSVLKFGYDKLKVHMTQKPVLLCEWLIKTYSNENDLVLDFTMGSGTSVIACINTKRNYIGVEKDSDIFKIAENRINEALKT